MHTKPEPVIAALRIRTPTCRTSGRYYTVEEPHQPMFDRTSRTRIPTAARPPGFAPPTLGSPWAGPSTSGRCAFRAFGIELSLVSVEAWRIRCPDFRVEGQVRRQALQQVLFLFHGSHACFVAEALATRAPSEDARFQKLPAADFCCQLKVSVFEWFS